MSATVIRRPPPLQCLSPRERASWLAARYGYGTREKMLANCYRLAARAAARGNASEATAWHRLIGALTLSLECAE